MENNTQIFKFTDNELWFLMGQFGPSFIIGMENPHLGWLIEEIEEADRTALQALIQKGMVKVIDAGNIDLDDTVASMVKGCAHPEHTLIVHAGNKEQNAGQNRYIHFAGGNIIEHVEAEPGRHELSLIKDRDEILSRLKDCLHTDTKTKGSDASFTVPEEILYDAASLYSQGHKVKGKKLLQGSGMEPACAAALADALNHPVVNASFTMIRNQNDPKTQHVNGFGILEGADQFWMMKPVTRDGKQVVEFTPTDAKSVRKHFVELLP